MAAPRHFTPLRVSTTTVTSSFPFAVNIIDVAKYLPLDDVIIGIKLIYAGGHASIVRGVSKVSTKPKDFYNQATVTIRLPIRNTCDTEEKSSILVSCKIFHNGTLHVTGTHNLDESCDTLNHLAERLLRLHGFKMVLMRPQLPFLCSHDNILYDSDGNIIGWMNYRVIDDDLDGSEIIDHILSKQCAMANKNWISLRNEYVMLERLQHYESSHLVFVSNKWVDNRKQIYTLDGEYVGHKQLVFKLGIARRRFEVKYGYIYAGRKIVGTEHIEWVSDSARLLQLNTLTYLLERGCVVHPVGSFSASERDLLRNYRFSYDSIKVYMINMYFKSPFAILRNQLHRILLENGYKSRYEPCSHAAVNFRFHYHPSTIDDWNNCGKCLESSNRTTERCKCKDISISCFNSGRMNITGLSNHEQGDVVYNFVKRFFIEHEESIVAK
jgi:hypothetical protein